MKVIIKTVAQLFHKLWICEKENGKSGYNRQSGLLKGAYTTQQGEVAIDPVRMTSQNR